MPDKNSKKSFPKIILVSLILIALITGVYFTIRSNLAKEEIKGLIISKLENAMERGIYIEKVKDYSFKSVTLSNFKIFQDKSLKEEDLLLEAKEIIINYNLDLFSALRKKMTWNIEDMIIVEPQMTLVRDSQGTFDFMKKFNLRYNNFLDKFTVNKVNIKSGNLFYKDYQVYKEDGLLTIVKSLNGSFYLGNLPQVEFDGTGLKKEDDTLLTLKGYFCADGSNYSLDFNFKNADITHFQYYVAQAEPFNLKKGLFDLTLHLDFDKNNTQNNKIIWYGSASTKNTELLPDFLGGLEIKQLEGVVKFDSKETTIEKITAFYKNSPFTLQGKVTYPEKLNYCINVLSDDFKLNDLKEYLKSYLPLSNELKVEGKSNLSFIVSGSEEDFQAQGELLTKQGNIEGYDLANLETEFQYNREGIYFKNIKAEIGGGNIEGSGRINLKDELPKYNLLFNLTRLSVESDLLKSLHLNYLKNGPLSGKVEIKDDNGELEKINLSTEIRIEDKAGILSLNAKGTITKNNYLDLKVKTTGINLEALGEILNYQGIKGLASFNGSLSGLPDDLKISGKIEAEKGQISELPFDFLEGKINYQANKVQLEEVIFRNKGLVFKGKGNIDLLEKKNIYLDLTLQLEQADLNYLATLYNYDLSVLGLVQGEISLQGNWPQVVAKGDLKLKDINLVNYKAESGNLIFTLKDKKIKIENLVLKSGEAQLYSQGEINLEEDLPLDLRVNFLNQNIRDLLVNFTGLDLISKFKGQATGSLEIKGNYTSPDLYLSALIEDAQLEEMPLNSIDIKLDKIGSRLRINKLKLKQSKGEFIGNGWIDFDQNNKNLKISISANNIDLGQLSHLFRVEEEIKGLVNFKAEIEGDLNLPTISFGAQIEKAEFSGFYFDRLSVEALYNQDILEVKQFILDKDGHQIKGNGKIPYKFSFLNQDEIAPSLANLPLDFNLTLQNTDLSFMKIFFKKELKQVQGLTNADLKLSGTLNHPILNGSITLTKGEVEFYALPSKISDLSILLQLEDNLVKIEDMNFQMDQYKIYTSGEFALNNLQPQDLDINIWNNKEEEILYQDIFKAQVALNAKVTGSFTSPHIKGSLTLSKGELNWKENDQETPSDLSEFLSKLINIKGDIDLQLKVADDFTAKTKDFNMKLEGDLKVQGTLSAPKLNGELEIKQGYIDFLDKKFRISRGKAIFSNSSGKDLILNLEAKTEIDSINVFLSLSGILAQPMMVLSSSPPLSESEIISLLMFNKNYAGLTEGEMGTILKEEMINLIAQGLSIRFLNQIENEVANSLGLDEFKIETIFKQDQGSNFAFIPGFALESLVLKIGKYFSENFYLTYSTPLNEIGKSNIELEYKIKDDFTLNTQVGLPGLQHNSFEFKIELKYGF